MLEISQQDGIQYLQMMRPPVNALNLPLIRALDQAIADALQQPAVRVLVLSGLPGVFSAGLDIKELTRDRSSAVALVEAFFDLQKTLALSSKPLIAAISGHCPAGGTVLSLLCDQRLMVSADCRIGLNEVQVGLYPGQVVFRIFERLLGTRLAADFLSRGAMLDPAQALAAGLVDELCAPEDLLARAGQRARELLQLPAKTYSRTRALVRSDLCSWYQSPPESLQALMAEGWVDEEALARLR